MSDAYGIEFSAYGRGFIQTIWRVFERKPDGTKRTISRHKTLEAAQDRLAKRQKAEVYFESNKDELI